MDLDQMKELGVENIYLDLNKYISEFIDNNYPLTKEDMKSILDNEPTFNVTQRQEIQQVMKAEMENILKKEMENNAKVIEQLQQGKQAIVPNIDLYKQIIFNHKQQLLEAVYEYKNNMTKTETIFVNEESIKDAVNEGISGEAVEATLQDVLDKTNVIGKTPEQMKETVEVIVDMKKDVGNKVDEKYQSNFVKENNEKINSAINDGIEPDEIAVTLVNSTEKANTKTDKRHLKFMVNLISKMKKRELRLKKDKENVQEKGHQKVFTDK